MTKRVTVEKRLVVWPLSMKEGESVSVLGALVTVKAACADKNGGQWVCVLHSEAFANQLQKDTHLSAHRSRCKLLWNCFTHGPEQP